MHLTVWILTLSMTVVLVFFYEIVLNCSENVYWGTKYRALMTEWLLYIPIKYSYILCIFCNLCYLSNTVEFKSVIYEVTS